MKGIFPIDKFRTLQTPFYYYDTKVLRDTLSAINHEAVSYTHLLSVPYHQGDERRTGAQRDGTACQT